MDKNIMVTAAQLGLALGSVASCTTVITKELTDDWFDRKYYEAFRTNHPVKAGLIAYAQGFVDAAVPAACAAVAAVEWLSISNKKK